MRKNLQPARISVRSNMRRSAIYPCPLACAAVLAGAAALRAEHTRYWRQASFDGFPDAARRSASRYAAMGTLPLAPCFTPVADVNLAFLWASRCGLQGQS